MDLVDGSIRELIVSILPLNTLLKAELVISAFNSGLRTPT